jgi:plasmid stability protein
LQVLHGCKYIESWTIRNLNASAYRALKARAAQDGKSIGQAVSEAIQAYAARPLSGLRVGSLRDLTPEQYPAEHDRLSEEIDAVVYGA